MARMCLSCRKVFAREREEKGGGGVVRSVGEGSAKSLVRGGGEGEGVGVVVPPRSAKGRQVGGAGGEGGLGGEGMGDGLRSWEE